MTVKFTVQYEDGKFWKDVGGNDNIDCQEIFETTLINTMANGFKWSMSVQGCKQRKRHCRSVVTSTIDAMLDSVVAELKADMHSVVYCNTPDIEVQFSC